MELTDILQKSDQFNSELLLTDAERGAREAVRVFNEEHAAKEAADRWVDGRLGSELLPELAGLNLVGGGVTGYGCSGRGDVTDGLVAAELAKVDFGFSAFFGIQSVLALRAVAELGTEEQKNRWLPGLARIELIGSMGITEPSHGSDTSSMETTARRTADGYVLNGRKKWVGNASFADLNIIFAKDENGQASAFVVEKGTPGFDATPIEGKVAMRSSLPANVELTEVHVPADNRLEASKEPRQAAAVFNAVRPIAAWQSLGISIGAFEATLAYLSEREQFGRRLIEFQLVQQKLAEMAVSISTMRLICLQVSRLLENGQMTHVAASAAKMTCARQGREIVAKARDLMGGNGILAEYIVGRHFADMEAIYTYDGTDHIQSLIIGKAVTGVSALR